MPESFEETAREPVTDQEERTEPGTWREIIARFDVDDERAGAPIDVPTVPWEIAAMTTPEYTAPQEQEQEQEQAEHEEEEEEEEEEEKEQQQETVASVAAGEGGEAGPPLEPEEGEADDDELDAEFPLDAFIVPGGSQRIPAGYESEMALQVAEHLDAIAEQLRAEGLSVLGRTAGSDELSRVLAAIVAGYVTRDR